jgi:hypothetical protein
MERERKQFSLEEFTARVTGVARRVDPALQVRQAGHDLLVVAHPGSGDVVWVKAMDEGEKFAVFKTRADAPKPAHLDAINPIGEGFLADVLRNYVREVGHFRL